MLTKEWNTQYGYLIEYYGRYRTWPYGEDVFPEGNPIGRWCDSLRDAFNQNSLSHLQRSKLLSVGFSFMSLSEKWMLQFEYLKQFITHEGRFPDYDEQFPPGNFLGRWFQIQTISKRNGLLSAEEEHLFSTLLEPKS